MKKTTAYARKLAQRRVHTDPMALAKHFATGFSASELEAIEKRVKGHFDKLRRGEADRIAFAGVSTTCELSLAIESQGVVRGLHYQLEEAERVMHELKRRADLPEGWKPPVLHWHELDAIEELNRLHLFQLKQLSYGEYQAAWRLMVGRVTSNGGQVIEEATA